MELVLGVDGKLSTLNETCGLKEKGSHNGSPQAKFACVQGCWCCEFVDSTSDDCVMLFADVVPWWWCKGWKE